MKSKRTRLDRFLSVRLGINRRDIKILVAQKKIFVEGKPVSDSQQLIDEFTHVMFDERVLQSYIPRYMMMNKPIGVVSATKDEAHTTVIDVLGEQLPTDLHIVGRLDFNSSGLLLLTNDGRWSRRITDPDNKVVKVYRVTLAKDVNQSYVDAFAEGMYFAYEDIHTRPAELKILSEREAEVRLVEGRYHQIKRMFGRFQNEVLTLHRVAVGNLSLDAELGPGEYRPLLLGEVNAITSLGFCPGNLAL